MNCPHCNTRIDEHEANRCLDAWVAEAVMGWKIRNNPDIPSIVEYWDGTLLTGLKYEYWREPPYFSDDIAAAWEVVGRLYGRNGGYFMLERFDSELGGDWRTVLGVEDIDGVAPSAPLAICRAAIKAAYVGEDKK